MMTLLELLQVLNEGGASFDFPSNRLLIPVEAIFKQGLEKMEEAMAVHFETVTNLFLEIALAEKRLFRERDPDPLQQLLSHLQSLGFNDELQLTQLGWPRWSVRLTESGRIELKCEDGQAAILPPVGWEGWGPPQAVN